MMLRVRVISKNFITGLLPSRFVAITLYPFIFINLKRNDPSFLDILDHELVHIDQVRENGWLKFYFTYLKDYVSNIRRGSKDPYMDIPAEKEAYSKESKNAMQRRD